MLSTPFSRQLGMRVTVWKRFMAPPDNDGVERSAVRNAGDRLETELSDSLGSRDIMSAVRNAGDRLETKIELAGKSVGELRRQLGMRVTVWKLKKFKSRQITQQDESAVRNAGDRLETCCRGTLSGSPEE